MRKRTFRIRCEVEVYVDVGQAVLDRVDDQFRENLYDLRTEEEIVAHLAWNLGLRKQRLSALDGWADMDDSMAKSDLDDPYFLDFVEVTSDD